MRRKVLPGLFTELSYSIDYILTIPGTYITAYTSIAAHSVHKDGVLLYRDAHRAGTSDFLLNAYKHFEIDYPKFYKMDQLCQLGFLAVEVLLQGRQIANEYSPAKVGIVFSNANSSLNADLHYFESVKNIPSPAQFVYTLPNIVIGEISIRHRCKGENAFFVSDRFDAAFIQFYVQDILERNRVDACICGWVEC
ncbi:MAG TPA: hypothetical protein VFV68_14705, partial [Agriterribacter sp.]|nr:hypothetical protein [Agriterribacter sp.]